MSNCTDDTCGGSCNIPSGSLFCKDQKVPSDKYRKGYDEIQWVDYMDEDEESQIIKGDNNG